MSTAAPIGRARLLPISPPRRRASSSSRSSSIWRGSTEMRKLALLCLALTSCGTTGGKLIQISFRAGGLSRAAAGPLTFTTSTGWTVTLQKARIALGPFYFNNQSAMTDSFRGGLVIIEATEQVVIDPLDPTLKDIAGGADGQTGDALSCEIGLLQADQTASAT